MYKAEYKNALCEHTINLNVISQIYQWEPKLLNLYSKIEPCN